MLHLNLRELPRVIVFGQVRQREGWHPQGREQPQHMMLFIQDGEMEFECENERYMLVKGDFLLLPKGTFYRPYTEIGCQFYFVHFEIAQTPKFLSEKEEKMIRIRRSQLFSGRTDSSAYALPVDNHEDFIIPIHGKMGVLQEKIGLLLAECEMERYAITPQKKTSIDLRFTEILNLLDQNMPDSGMQMKAAPPLLTRIMMFIHLHYSETVTLSRLSETFHVSKQYIAMLFREYMGTSVTQYVNRLKLDHALDLLRYSTFQIGEISDRLGFSNAYYFCRLFRKHFDMTPSEYIRLYGERGK